MNGLRRPGGFTTLAIAAALLGTACSNNTGPASASLTSAQADSLSAVVTTDVQSEVDFSTANGSGVVGPGAPANTPPPPCVSRSPASPTNSDADPVPDSARLTYNDCVVNYALGGSDTVRGTIDVLDPTPTTTDHAWKHIFTDFTRIHTGPLGRQWTWVLNGTRQIIGDSAQLAFTSTNVRTDYTWPNGATASHVRSWSITFTADTAGQIQPDSPLPAGTLTLSGNSTWTRGSNTWNLVASTTTPLHYNPTCTVRPMFDAGELKFVVTRNGATTNVTIQFTACGQYTVTRS
ncbi:MAG TPA: hypothetical protein VIW26_11725 [Gemmatimonadales bacterium]|jgi:hypothetical protein